MRFLVTKEFLHTTVLKSETIAHIIPTKKLINHLFQTNEKNLFFVDGTLGGGGHAVELIKNFAAQNFFKDFTLNLIAFDQDLAAIENASHKLNPLKDEFKNLNIHIFHSNFSNLKNIVHEHFNGQKLHGIYADFGVSSPQLDWGDRGFSINHNGPLDMRMNTQSAFSAQNIINEYSEQKLTKIFFDYGEEPKARKLAKAIVEARKKNTLPLYSTSEFAQFIKKILAYPMSRVHPATRTFQALRIEVNNEIGSIETLLQDIPSLIHPNGKAAFISFHSLEDRLVKHAMRNWQKGKQSKEKAEDPKPYHIPLHLMRHMEENHKAGFGKESPRGGLTASESECKANPRSRSARLRCFEFALPERTR